MINYTNFTTWITPTIIKPLFYILSFGCILWGGSILVANASHRTGANSYTVGDSTQIAIGWVWILLGPLALRVICETIAAIFLLSMGSQNNPAVQPLSEGNENERAI